MKNFNIIKKTPYMIFIIGFAIIIFIGTILLKLPISSVNGRSLGFIDAFFTATSATCVTGLAVVNTADYFTVFGKVVITILIQVGGLGIMTISAMVSFFIGKKISLSTRVLIMEERNSNELQGVVKLTKYIVIYTFLAELIGAIFFSFVFVKDYGVDKGIAFSLFHSISSFCNAGFDLMGNSMTNYVHNPIINITVSLLVIVGGIGFFVFWDIYQCKSFKRLCLHSKLVIIITSILLIGGATLFFFLEYSNISTIGNLNLLGKIQASIFQSMTTRTAGFNSVEIGNLRMPTVFIMVILMFIGGSSTSTAGGIKTTTMGVIFISIYNLVKGKRDIEIFEKSITYQTALKAVAIVGIATFIISISAFVLTITELNMGFSFLDILFEVVSAFSTVGLTRGITADLSQIGRILLSFVMFIGRVGPLTVAFALMKENKNLGNYTYAEGKIIIG